MIGVLINTLLNWLFWVFMIGLILGYIWGSGNGAENVQEEAVKKDAAVYVKTFENGKDGSRKAIYTFAWKADVKQGAEFVKELP